MTRAKDYAGIDYFRLIASFMVIAIHTSPFGILSKDVDYMITYCLGRIAVPFFLMVTGYFVLAPYVASDFCKECSIRKYVKKNLLLYLTATICYLPITLYSGNMPHTIMEWIKWLVFDGTFYHLWYFPAVIIGCILLMILVRKSIKLAVYFSIIAYVIGLFGDSYYGVVKNIPVLRTLYKGIFYISSYTRNGIFFAPIFLLLGMLLTLPEARCQKAVCKRGLMFFLVLMFLEGFITYHFNIQKHNSMYVFLIPVMYFLFQLLLMISGKAPTWIRNSSMLIYIIHPAVIVLLRGIAKMIYLTNLLIDNTIVQYFFVCALSMVIAFFIQRHWKGDF